MATKNKKLDVWFYGTKKKRPIAYSTKATSDTLVLLKPKAASWEELKKLCKYDKDARDIVDIYVEQGEDYDDIQFR